MASMQTYLKNILSSRYGKDVRQSIHDAIEELNAVAVTAQGSASISAQTASTKASEANASKTSAAASAKAAEDAAARAVAVSGVGVASETVAGLMAGGDNMVDDSGALVLTRKTTDRTLNGSKDGGGVKINQIAGVSQQDSEPTPDVPQDIKSSIVGKIRCHRKNMQYNSATYEGWLRANSGGTVLNETYNGGKIAKYTISWNHFYPPSRLFKAGTYTISFDAKVKTAGSVHIYNLVGESKSLWLTASDTFSRYSFTFTVKEDRTGYVIPMIPSGSTVEELYIANIQVEEGEATPYEPYVEKSIQLSAPITLRGNSGVKDIICKQDGMYGVLKNVGQQILSELNGVSNISGKCVQCYSWSFAGRKGLSGTDGLCDKFTFSVSTDTSFEHAVFNGAASNKNLLYFFIDKSRLSVSAETTSAYLTAINNWLKLNNITVEYPLTTPVFEPLPIADQIALHQLETFDAVTHIVTDSVIEPVIECEYGTSFAGAYAIKGMNTAEANRLEIEQLKATTLSLSNALLESEV